MVFREFLFTLCGKFFLCGKSDNIIAEMGFTWYKEAVREKYHLGYGFYGLDGLVRYCKNHGQRGDNSSRLIQNFSIISGRSAHATDGQGNSKFKLGV